MEPVLSAPPPASVQAGDFVRLSFAVQGLDPHQGTMDKSLAPEAMLPLGWSLLVPPTTPSMVSPNKNSGHIAFIVQVPMREKAGRYPVELVWGPSRVSTEVVVEANVSVEVSDQSQSTDNRWWIEKPMAKQLEAMATGNQSLTVRWVAITPTGIEVRFSSEKMVLEPWMEKSQSLTIEAMEPMRWPAGSSIPIRLEVVDAIDGSVMATHQIGLVVLSDQAQWLDQATMPIEGHVGWAQTLGDIDADQTLDWGVAGVVPIHHRKSLDAKGRLRFSWMSDDAKAWGRYLDYQHNGFRSRIGYGVFGQRGVDLSPQLGRGVSILAGHNTRIGWQSFVGRDARYTRPWMERNGWRLAWNHRQPHGSPSHSVNYSVNHPTNHSNSTNRSDQRWWSVAYQSPSDLSPGQSGHAQVSVAEAGVASWLDYRRLLSANRRLHLEFRSVPKDHPSGVRPGQMAFVGLTHQGKGHARAELSIGHWEAPMRQPTTTIRWQGRGRVGSTWTMGLVGEHRFSKESMTSKGPNKTRLDLIASGGRNGLSWRGGIGLDRRWHVRLAGKNTSLGRWHFHHQSASGGFESSRMGVEGQRNSGWYWALGLERRQGPRLDGMWTDRGFGTIEDWNGSEDVGPGGGAETEDAFRIALSRRWTNAGVWSLAWMQSIDNWPNGQLLLRYRWQHRQMVPKRSFRALGEVHGKVIQQSKQGGLGVAGAWVWLGKRATQTDDQGRYRFVGVEAGAHSLRLEQEVDGHWPERGQQMQLTIGAGETKKADWRLVSMAQVIGRVDWPQDSPDSFKALGEHVVMGRCMSCPPAHRHRRVAVDEDGAFGSDRLMPGRWQWQLIGPSLPDGHTLLGRERVVDLSPSEVSSLVFEIQYESSAEQWRNAQPIVVAPRP